MGKWVKLSKEDYIIQRKYEVPFGELDVFLMEFIRDENPQLLKSSIKENLMKQDFYDEAVYQTVRKSVGKGVWI